MCKGFGFVRCSSRSDMLKLISLNSRLEFRGRLLTLRQFKTGKELQEEIDEFNERRVFVGNICSTVQLDELWHLFSKYGPIENVYLVNDEGSKKSKFGYVIMKQTKDADNILYDRSGIYYKERLLSISKFNPDIRNQKYTEKRNQMYFQNTFKPWIRNEKKSESNTLKDVNFSNLTRSFNVRLGAGDLIPIPGNKDHDADPDIESEDCHMDPYLMKKHPIQNSYHHVFQSSRRKKSSSIIYLNRSILDAVKSNQNIPANMRLNCLLRTETNSNIAEEPRREILVSFKDRTHNSPQSQHRPAENNLVFGPNGLVDNFNPNNSKKINIISR